MKKRDEFGQMKSTDDFWHYKEARFVKKNISGLHITWLLAGWETPGFCHARYPVQHTRPEKHLGQEHPCHLYVY